MCILEFEYQALGVNLAFENIWNLMMIAVILYTNILHLYT